MSYIREIIRYRHAFNNLFLQDFRVRYRNMSLGVLWSVVNPLMMLAILVGISTVAMPGNRIAQFPVFTLIGLVVYNMVSLSLSSATVSIVSNTQIVKKVMFPRMLLPVSVVSSQFVHSMIQLMLVFLFAFIYKVEFTRFWLWVPVICFVVFLFATGMAMLTSALHVYFRDVRYVVDNSLSVLFWLCPVFYPLSAVTDNSRAWVGWVYQLNPIAGCIDAMRRAIIYAQHPDPVAFGMAAIVAVAFGVVGYLVFRKMEPLFPDLV